MKYWWVNQNQTFRHEYAGGYLWSPKRNKNGASNRAYEAMKSITPGDFVFSFANSQIKAYGLAVSNCYEFPKPTEFGTVGEYWEKVGWRVDIQYREIFRPIRPKDHIAAILPFLPSLYSPLQANGNGNQTFYLYGISRDLTLTLAQLIDPFIVDIINQNAALESVANRSATQNINLWEDKIEQLIKRNNEIGETTRESLVLARRGQGQFRNNLLAIENKCRVTRVSNQQHLVASHTKPWRDCSNEERLDPENGFMLTPTIDHLFDRGFISFDDSGDLLISSSADKSSLAKMGVRRDDIRNVGTFTERQRHFLDWHRNSILLSSRI